MMSNKLVVGSPECSVADVAEIMNSDTHLGLLFDKWADIAMGLRIPSHVSKDLKLKKNLENITLKTIQREMIDLWVQNKGSQAYLDDLLMVFEKNGMKNLSEALQSKFQEQPVTRVVGVVSAVPAAQPLNNPGMVEVNSTGENYPEYDLR